MAGPAAAGVKHWEVEVIATFPHDRQAFTQGLEFHDGVLYESAGGFGTSWVGTSELATAAVKRRVAAPAGHFVEGITIVGDKIWQLTWQNGVAVLRDRATLAPLREVAYSGEGWGICLSGERLVMSDGTAELTFRDPSSFAELSRVTVTLGGVPLERLNELECVGDLVWANVWYSEQIVRIDPRTGRVTDVVQVGELPGLAASDRPSGTLNGIAALPDTTDLLITGKNWPHLYQIKLK